MKKVLLLFTFTFSLLTLHAQIISTVAGNNTYGFSGDGWLATLAELRSPTGVASDASGNIYIADSYNSVIRIVNTSGIINTVAGNHATGCSGDGGPATAAELYSPYGVAFDASGNMYIADEYVSVVRKVNTSGIISTVAGNCSLGSGYSGDGGPATAAELYNPYGVAADASGNIYIADYLNSVIRKVNTSGIISTMAGNHTTGYSGNGGPATAAKLYDPTGVAVDASGNIYIADYWNFVIRKVNTSGIISTVAGNNNQGYSGNGGQATAAELNYPEGVSFDASGNMYIADEQNNVIRKVNTSGIISTVAGNNTRGYSGNGGQATAAELNYPYGVAFDASGNMYIADDDNNVVRKVANMVTGVNEPLSSGMVINIYPNPGNGVFTLRVNSEKLKVNSVVEVYNMLGEKVYSRTFSIEHSTPTFQSGQAFNIDLNSQPNGTYLLKVQNEDGTVLTKKVEIAR